MSRAKALGAMICISALLIALPCLAARHGVVDDDDVVLYQGAGKKFRALGKVPRGTRLDAANVPSAGFFKVRLRDGRVGWIVEEALQLDPPSRASGDSDPPPPLRSDALLSRPIDAAEDLPPPTASLPAAAAKPDSALDDLPPSR